jgi:hypothetical protein
MEGKKNRGVNGAADSTPPLVPAPLMLGQAAVNAVQATTDALLAATEDDDYVAQMLPFLQQLQWQQAKACQQ